MDSYRSREGMMITVIGDAGVGKTSLISSLVSEIFSERVPPVLQPVIVPPDLKPEKIPLAIVDTSTLSAPSAEAERIHQLHSSDALVLVCSPDIPSSLTRVITHWLPYLTSIQVARPVIVAVNKSDLSISRSTFQTIKQHVSSAIQSLLSSTHTISPSSGSAPPIAVSTTSHNLASSSIASSTFPSSATSTSILSDVTLASLFSPLVASMHLDAAVTCSARSLTSVSDVFFIAQRAIISPTAPLFNPITRSLTPDLVRALLRIFRVFDVDNDGLLSEAELTVFQATCFGPSAAIPYSSLNVLLRSLCHRQRQLQSKQYSLLCSHRLGSESTSPPTSIGTSSVYTGTPGPSQSASSNVTLPPTSLYTPNTTDSQPSTSDSSSLPISLRFPYTTYVIGDCLTFHGFCELIRVLLEARRSDAVWSILHALDYYPSLADISMTTTPTSLTSSTSPLQRLISSTSPSGLPSSSPSSSSSSSSSIVSSAVAAATSRSRRLILGHRGLASSLAQTPLALFSQVFSRVFPTSILLPNPSHHPLISSNQQCLQSKVSSFPPFVALAMTVGSNIPPNTLRSICESLVTSSTTSRNSRSSPSSTSTQSVALSAPPFLTVSQVAFPLIEPVPDAYHISVRADVLSGKFVLSSDQSASLTAEGIRFLTELFITFDTDRDGLLSSYRSAYYPAVLAYHTLLKQGVVFNEDNKSSETSQDSAGQVHFDPFSLISSTQQLPSPNATTTTSNLEATSGHGVDQSFSYPGLNPRNSLHLAGASPLAVLNNIASGGVAGVLKLGGQSDVSFDLSTSASIPSPLNDSNLLDTIEQESYALYGELERLLSPLAPDDAEILFPSHGDIHRCVNSMVPPYIHFSQPHGQVQSLPESSTSSTDSSSTSSSTSAFPVVTPSQLASHVDRRPQLAALVHSARARALHTHGFLTLEGWLSRWAALTLFSPDRALAYMAALGYNGPASRVIFISPESPSTSRFTGSSTTQATSQLPTLSSTTPPEVLSQSLDALRTVISVTATARSSSGIVGGRLPSTALIGDSNGSTTSSTVDPSTNMMGAEARANGITTALGVQSCVRTHLPRSLQGHQEDRLGGTASGFITKGCVYGLVLGSRGCGKTTLLQRLAGKQPNYRTNGNTIVQSELSPSSTRVETTYAGVVYPLPQVPGPQDVANLTCIRRLLDLEGGISLNPSDHMAPSSADSEIKSLRAKVQSIINSQYSHMSSIGSHSSTTTSKFAPSYSTTPDWPFDCPNVPESQSPTSPHTYVSLSDNSSSKINNNTSTSRHDTQIPVGATDARFLVLKEVPTDMDTVALVLQAETLGPGAQFTKKKNNTSRRTRIQPTGPVCGRVDVILVLYDPTSSESTQYAAKVLAMLPEDIPVLCVQTKCDKHPQFSKFTNHRQLISAYQSNPFHVPIPMINTSTSQLITSISSSSSSPQNLTSITAQTFLQNVSSDIPPFVATAAVSGAYLPALHPTFASHGKLMIPACYPLATCHRASPIDPLFFSRVYELALQPGRYCLASDAYRTSKQTMNRLRFGGYIAAGVAAIAGAVVVERTVGFSNIMKSISSTDAQQAIRTIVNRGLTLTATIIPTAVSWFNQDKSSSSLSGPSNASERNKNADEATSTGERPRPRRKSY